MLVGIAARTFDLGIPDKILFDEAHYVKCARAFLEHRHFFNDHPAFGKLLIGMGMYFLGDNSVGWRLLPSIIGCLTLIVAPLLSFALFRSYVAALLCGAFFALDGFFIAYSRTAHQDGMMLFFALLGILCAKVGEHRSVGFSLVAGFSVGLAGAMKVNGLWALIPICYIYWQNRRYIPSFYAFVGAVFAYVLTAILAYQIMGANNPVEAAIRWQQDSINFHTSSMGLHAFSSKWYTWPFFIKPIMMSFGGVDAPGEVVITLANPALIWSTSMLLVFMLFSAAQIVIQDRPIIRIFTPAISLCVIGFLANFVPWMLISRPAFFYHYMPSYAMLIIVITGLVPYWLKRVPLLTTIWIVLILISGLVYLPMSTATQMTAAQLKPRNIVECWFERCRWAPS